MKVLTESESSYREWKFLRRVKGPSWREQKTPKTGGLDEALNRQEWRVTFGYFVLVRSRNKFHRLHSRIYADHCLQLAWVVNFFFTRKLFFSAQHQMQFVCMLNWWEGQAFESNKKLTKAILLLDLRTNLSVSHQVKQDSKHCKKCKCCPVSCFRKQWLSNKLTFYS